jgi:pimeloyl-ACP methyl ester carboxylesterase
VLSAELLRFCWARCRTARLLSTQHSALSTVNRVLYFHGFASSPRSEKIRLLRDLLAPDVELATPDLNVPSFEQLDFEAMVRLGVETGQRIGPCAVAGSSLGALVALEVVRRGIERPLVLIAPALGVVSYWISRIPPGDPVEVFNYARNANAPIHRAFFHQMALISADDEPPPVPVTIFMGRNDETLPFARVREVWDRWAPRTAPGSRFVEIADGDHGLVGHVEKIAEGIRTACRSSFSPLRGEKVARSAG